MCNTCGCKDAESVDAEMTVDEVNEMVKNLGGVAYNEFCYRFDIDPEDAQEMSWFIADHYDSPKIVSWLMENHDKFDAETFEADYEDDEKHFRISRKNDGETIAIINVEIDGEYSNINDALDAICDEKNRNVEQIVFGAESFEAETWGVQIYDTDLTMADVKKMLKEAGIKTKGSVRKIGNGYGYYFKFDSSHQSKFEKAFKKFGKAGNYEYEAESFGAESFEAESECIHCGASTLDDSDLTFDDVGLCEHCGECEIHGYHIEFHEGCPKCVFDAESFEAENYRTDNCIQCGKFNEYKCDECDLSLCEDCALTPDEVPVFSDDSAYVSETRNELNRKYEELCKGCVDELTKYYKDDSYDAETFEAQTKLTAFTRGKDWEGKPYTGQIFPDHPDLDHELADRNQDGKMASWERAIGNQVAKGKSRFKAPRKMIKTTTKFTQRKPITATYSLLPYAIAVGALATILGLRGKE